MANRRREPARLAALLLAAAVALPAGAQSAADMANTKHNLSVTGPGAARATTETRICVFCHTPHSAAPQSPLWNKALEPQVYSVYASPTLQAGPIPQPTGPTKLCLSCHDGTIAMGAVINPAGGIAMAGDTLPSGSLSNFGTDLSGHHPVSFPYHAALPNPELEPTPPSDLVYGATDEIHCVTCHDPHDDTYGRFLVKDNRFSALCVSCHQIAGWAGSAHAMSTAPVTGILPRPPKTWPTYTQLGEWGCEACHTPHFAPTPAQLLNFTEGPPAFSCTTAGCHTSQPGPGHGPTSARTSGAPADIARQVRKVSAHREVPGRNAPGVRGLAIARASTSSGTRCADCHNPHVGTSRRGEAPYASGLLMGVSGVDRNGGLLASVTYEYEVCFKCHGDDTPDLDHVPRVVPSTNLRLAFATDNPSFHPVVGTGKNPSVPSIPSSFEPAMRSTQMIYCTDCHADDEGGSRGPHGSSFAPILRERCETSDNTPEGFDVYALCYRCHDRSSILRNDSFRPKTLRSTPSGGGHSGHLAGGAPCSACHDPHGIYDPVAGTGATGAHTHLINFDLRIVSARPGTPFPAFRDTGNSSGSCTLVCHGFDHDATSYP